MKAQSLFLVIVQYSVSKTQYRHSMLVNGSAMESVLCLWWTRCCVKYFQASCPFNPPRALWNAHRTMRECAYRAWLSVIWSHRWQIQPLLPVTSLCKSELFKSTKRNKILPHRLYYVHVCVHLWGGCTCLWGCTHCVNTWRGQKRIFHILLVPWDKVCFWTRSSSF